MAKASIENRGFFRNLAILPKDDAPWSVVLVLIVASYLLAFWVRLEWIDYAQDHYFDERGEMVHLRPDMLQDGVALPNTHDSFYFGSVVQKAAFGRHLDNNLVPGVYRNGMITALPYWLIRLFPSLSIEKLLLWLPVFVAGFVCIPIVLIGRLYGSSAWGFLAACLAGITHSYYNRTLAGYYDTDMFSITVPAFSVFFLLAASRKDSVGYLFAATFSLLLGRFFYGSIQAVTCSLALGFIGYRFGLCMLDSFFARMNPDRSFALRFLSRLGSPFNCISFLLLGWVLFAEGWSAGVVVEQSPQLIFIGLLVPSVLLFLFLRLSKKSSMASSANASEVGRKLRSFLTVLALSLLFLGVFPLSNFGPFSGTWSKITGKLQSYSVVGKTGSTMEAEESSLKFLDVKTTIREASKIPFEVVRNRILADAPTCSCPRCMPGGLKNASFVVPASIIGLIGLFLLVLRYWEFCITLPFAAIAHHCFQGNVGLRFTVHVGNYAALGLVFVILIVTWGCVRFIGRKRSESIDGSRRRKWLAWVIGFALVAWIAIPNLEHAANYHSQVVYPKKNIEALKALDDASEPSDFVVTWWDYGSGCWYYGDARTFTSPAHQTVDNFLSSEILRATSQRKAYNLSRLKTETYVKLQEDEKEGLETYPTAVQAIFKDGKPDQVFYQGLLEDAAKEGFPLPGQTRDAFLYLPYEILRIFPTILSFSSRNLYFAGNEGSNSRSLREPPMMVLKRGERQGSSYVFDGGYRLNDRGELLIDHGGQKGRIAYGQSFEIDPSGGPARVVDKISVDGLNLSLKSDPTQGRRLVFVPHLRQLVILSADTFRSSFARRYLINRFDAQAYAHPLFEHGADPRKQPYFMQADAVTGQSADQLVLHMGGGYRIEVDLSRNLARLPGGSEPIEISFHRQMHDAQNARLLAYPPKIIDGAKFHLIQTTLPYYAGDRRHVVSRGMQSLDEIARSFGVPVQALAHYNGMDASASLEPDEEITVPGTGYRLGQSWFFMDQEAFDSVLVQGFFMEALDESLFEKIYATAWGKVYKLKNR